MRTSLYRCRRSLKSEAPLGGASGVVFFRSLLTQSVQNRGMVCVQRSSPFQAFLWTATSGILALPTLGGQNSAAPAINGKSSLNMCGIIEGRLAQAWRVHPYSPGPRLENSDDRDSPGHPPPTPDRITSGAVAWAPSRALSLHLTAAPLGFGYPPSAPCADEAVSASCP
jgi:hypothetical protein